MKFSDLVQQLGNKERSIEDVIRYVSTRTDDNSNYSLLLGAGCSITSGVRPASSLVQVWRKEILERSEEGRACLDRPIMEQREFLKRKHADWYDPTREYSSLFERRYDLQRQRRMFVESEVSKAFPSIGYAYLTSLIEAGVFRTVFTTNFDDLLNEAFYSYSTERPIVCAQDSSISSVTVTSKRPKIIKLHGDYLFDDLKSTVRETESLEINMRAKFTEFAKEAGIIVVGYSGSDRSIMDILSSLLKNEEYLKGGVYWCLREDSEVTEELRRLLWKERIYFVKIKGFDELFAEIFSSLNNGDTLPPALLTVARPSSVVDRLLSSQNAIPGTTDTLLSAKRKLASLTKRSAIAGLMVHADQDDRPALRGQPQGFTDDELLVLTEARSLLDDGKYDQAKEALKLALRSDCRPVYKRRLYEETIKVLRLQGDHAGALAILDQLVALNPDRASNYLLRANIELSEQKKFDSIQRAVSIDPYFAQAHLELAMWHIRAASALYGDTAREHREAALTSLLKCKELNPSRGNPAWTHLNNVTGQLFRHDKNERTRRQDEIASELAKQGPESFYYLNIKLDHAKDRSNKAGVDEVLATAIKVEEKRGLENAPWVADVQFDAMIFQGNDTGIKSLVARCEQSGLLRQDTDLAYRAAEALRTTVGDEDTSHRLLSDALREWDFDWDVLRTLFRQCLELKRVDDANRLYKVWSHKLAEKTRLTMLADLQEEQSQFDSAIETLDEISRVTGSPSNNHRGYLLIRAGKFQEAEKYTRGILESFNFTLEAYSEIVNYELARKRLGKKPDNNRLESLLKTLSEHDALAAISALLGRRDDMIRSLKQAYKKDRTFKYMFARWPVFAEYWSDKESCQAAGHNEPVSCNVGRQLS